jgi:EAL domain-containing protein (putative c-di-GMP-specific phosphodiesterase class I)
LEAFDRPFQLEGRDVHLSASIGVSLFPQDGQTADALIGNADVAMYRAKDSGRNVYQFFTREMSDETQRRVEIETELRAAVARGQLRLAYQPRVDLASGRITGCEALLRWDHPVLGPVPPGRFIPIAEDSGLIVPIGDWVLRTACAQNRAWQDAGLPPLVVSVNLSARQFLQQDVVAWVLGVLAQTGLPAERLELELTESLIAQDVEKFIATVNRLKEAGVRLAIDDFGTGYSSLSYLKRFRVDTLKIDQSFVRNLASEVDDATIALAVISLAHNLRMSALAEGVETGAQCNFLRLNRCDAMQGYFFSKPVPAAEMEAMLRAGKTLGSN